MSECIQYNYAANYDQLAAIGATLSDAAALREDVQQVFNALTDVYTGEAAAALQASHMQVSQQLDAIIYEIQGTRQAAEDRQGLTAEQDGRLAQAF